MEFDRDFVETLERIEPILTDLGLEHFLTGGLVAAFYGEPRLTQDADIVIRLPESQMDPLRESLESSFLVDSEDLLQAIRSGSLFQALDRETMVKIDFHIGGAIPGEFDRVKRVALFAGDQEYPIASKEDAILSKLLWIQKGSHKSRGDAIGMLLGPEPFDLKLVESIAEDLGVGQLFEELEQKARMGGGE